MVSDAQDVALIRKALDWCGCLDERYSDVMEQDESNARDALDRIEARLCGLIVGVPMASDG